MCMQRFSTLKTIHRWEQFWRLRKMDNNTDLESLLQESKQHKPDNQWNFHFCGIIGIHLVSWWWHVRIGGGYHWKIQGGVPEINIKEYQDHGDVAEDDLAKQTRLAGRANHPLNSGTIHAHHHWYQWMCSDDTMVSLKCTLLPCSIPPQKWKFHLLSGLC